MATEPPAARKLVYTPEEWDRPTVPPPWYSYAEWEKLERLERERIAALPEARKAIDRANAIRDGMVEPPWHRRAVAPPTTEPPTTEPPTTEPPATEPPTTTKPRLGRRVEVEWDKIDPLIADEISKGKGDIAAIVLSDLKGKLARPPGIRAMQARVQAIRERRIRDT